MAGPLLKAGAGMPITSGVLARALRCLLAAAVSVPLLGSAGSAAPAGAYAFLSQRSGHVLVARWNPCETITYRVNPANAPATAVEDVRGAVASVARASGLTFRYAGVTGVVPGRTPADYPAGTQLIVAWGDTGGEAGIGGATYAPGRTAAGDPALIIDHGMVVLDATGDAAAAPGLLRHELGHAVGLAHPLADDPGEIMYSVLAEGKTAWGAGDRAGLQQVGAAQGCLVEDPLQAAAPLLQAAVAESEDAVGAVHE